MNTPFSNPPAQWREIQTCTEPADRSRTESALAELYGAMGLAAPAVKWLNSPLAVIGRLTPHRRIRGVGPGTWPPFAAWRRSAPATYWGLRRERPAEDRGKCVGMQLRQLMTGGVPFGTPGPAHSVPDPVAPVVQSALSDWCYLETGERYELFPLWFLGQHDAATFAFHWWRREAGRSELSARRNRMLDAWVALLESSGWGLPCERTCYVCERPALIELDGEGHLHSNTCPAVLFRDGAAVWALNGVAVPEWLGAPAPEEIDPRRVVEVTHAAVRTEFIRKVGMERICKAFHAECIDRQGDYELLLLDFGGGERRPFLKMLNPSTGTWHVEGVAPPCRTVADALAWRNGTGAAPAALT